MILFIVFLINKLIICNNEPELYEIEYYKLVITMVGENCLTDSTNYKIDEYEEFDGCAYTKSDFFFNGERYSYSYQ